MKRDIAVVLITGTALVLFAAGRPALAQFNTQLNIGLLNALPQATTTDPPGNFHHVQPADFDPGKTYLVQSSWLSGLGCPTGAFIAVPNPSFTGVQGTMPFSEPTCTPGDPGDRRNQGLLMVKTGPIANFAAATAELVNVKTIVLSQIGYDLRKSGGDPNSPLGSHCGAGAPRFDIVTQDGSVYFVGCNSPPPVVESASTDWMRLRWGAGTPGSVAGFNASTGMLELITQPVQRIVIVFDEGSFDGSAPDNFGAAILDNVDVNGTLVGSGSVTAN